MTRQASETSSVSVRRGIVEQRLLAGAVEVFDAGSVERDAVEEAALRDRLCQEIGQMKVELDWLKKKAGVLD